MQTLLNSLYRDEEGFILSAELILIATIVVLSMIVGLAEVGGAINNELIDVSQAFDAVNVGNRDQSGNNSGDNSGPFGNIGGSGTNDDIVTF